MIDIDKIGVQPKGNSYVPADGGGIIKADKVINGHESTPKNFKPYGIIERVGIDGKVNVCAYYNEKGIRKKDINTSNHGMIKIHPYGKHGEHARDYKWNCSGKLLERTTREINEIERKENQNIL